MSLPVDLVAAASRAWVFIPDTATRHESSQYLLVRFPDYFEHPLALLGFRPDHDAPEVVAREVLDVAQGLGVRELVWWVKLGSAPGTDDMVAALGGVLDETLDVLALDLAGGVPDLGARDVPEAPDVEVRWTTDADTLRDSYGVITEVFGGNVPPEDRLELESLQTRYDIEHGNGGAVVAYLGGEPVGTGGLTLAGGVARLWSGAVREEHRGRGVYRALLDARLDFGVEHGASMALVKGRVQTSGPILRRAGFTAYGEERSYVIALSATV